MEKEIKGQEEVGASRDMNEDEEREAVAGLLNIQQSFCLLSSLDVPTSPSFVQRPIVSVHGRQKCGAVV